MKKVTSYSVFGEREKWLNSFSTNLRQHFTMYDSPDWELHIHTDREFDNVGYAGVLKKLASENMVKITIANNGNQKCVMMLWRLLPIWQNTDYVFCRDLDSILTVRQLQCVRTFISSGMTAHGINDNQSHDIPLMGGMCGFKSESFRNIFHNFDNLIGLARGIDWNLHGSDQVFLMKYVWPKIANSALIHRLSGPNYRSDIKVVTDADISDIPAIVRERGDNFTGYIGAVGTTTEKDCWSDSDIADFYNQHGNKEKCAILTKLEKEYGVELKKG